MNICIIAPVYNPEEAIPRVVSKLIVFRTPCLLVNNGSSVAVEQLISKINIDRRMDFDNDIVVRLYWHGAAVITTILTAVKYSSNGLIFLLSGVL